MDKTKLFLGDGSYIFVDPHVTKIKQEQLKDKELPRGLYMISKCPFILYQENWEWYVVGPLETCFLGYTTDPNIIEKVCQY